MSEYRDWRITLPFAVAPGDAEGAMTEVIFNAALELAPTDAAGMTARADTEAGKVWITFTLPESSADLANEVANEMLRRVKDAVLSGEDVCVSAA